MKGYQHPYDPAKAFNLYMECARAGVPRAMNAVAKMYGTGTGVDTNKVEALKWFQKAADAGYPSAWYNLGLIYKYADGAEQDFTKAYECFSKASALNYPSGWYGEGYMLYKGLGCEQDYQKAAALFLKGAAIGKPSCMFFLGLCYRNGYGLTANTDSARFWLAKASDKGYRFATDELAAKDPENDIFLKQPSQKLKSAKVDANPNVPSAYKKIQHNTQHADIQGKYSGYIIKYDWSGRHIISQSKLTVRINVKDSIVKGQWVEDDTVSLAFDAAQTDSALIFTQAQYNRTDHYHPVTPVLWQFKKARLELVQNNDSVYLAGNLQLYSPKTKEPGKPLYISLVRGKAGDNHETIKKSSLGEPNGQITDIIAFPNPFSDGLNLSFTLQNQCDVKVAVYDLLGNVVVQTSFNRLPSGRYTKPLTMNVAAGTYLVKVTCGESVVTTIVVKQ